MESDREAAPRARLVAIGERLKAAREKKGLAIDQVQKQTRIYSSVLSALEEGRCDELLTSVYVRGFLKKYSHYLGLDSNELLKEYSYLHPEEEKRNFAQDKFATRGVDLDLLSKFVFTISVLLLTAAIIYLASFLVNRVTSSFKKPKAKRIEVASSRKAMPKAKAPSRVPTQAKPTKEEAIQPQKPSPPSKGPFNLVLKVKEPVKVQVKKDGTLLFSRVLGKGLVESFTANEKIELYVARAEAIELVLDGRLLGSPGKGVIKNLEVTKKGISIK